MCSAATEFTGGDGHSVAKGAEVVIAAVQDVSRPSGQFVDREGVSAW